MTNKHTEKIKKMELILPPAPKPAGVYRPTLVIDRFLYVSGQGPVNKDGTYIIGKVGSDLNKEEAKKAGADLVGLDEYVEKIKKGWVDVDVIVTMPSVMGKLGPLGKVLGPRGLMPNPKTGTVTMDIAKAVTEIKGGKIDFKVDKTGIIHASVGKVSFTADKIMDNANELINTIVKLKPSGSKGTYIKSISMSSTMSPGIAIESKFE